MYDDDKLMIYQGNGNPANILFPLHNNIKMET